MKKFLSILSLSIINLQLSLGSIFAIEEDPGDGSDSGPGAIDIGNQIGSFFAFTCIQQFVFRIVDIAITLSGILLFVYLVWGGVEWLTSGGDKAKIESARGQISNAIIGITIIATSYAIWQLILYFLGINLNHICTIDPIG